MILDPSTIAPDQTFEADVAVIGSGAGGAVVAKQLAEAGLRIVVLEEGRYQSSRDFTQLEADMLPRLYREQASRATADLSALVVQGCTAGGSTVPSFCLCFRPPTAILDHWEQRLGLDGTGSALMAPFFERVERILAVQPTRAEDVNVNNARFRSGAESLHLRGRLPEHSRVDCVGCGFCALGCAYDRKNDALTAFLPAASAAGAQILPQCAVESIETAGGRATGARGTVVDDSGRRVSVRVAAKAVVLAAGAVGSAQLWRRSRLPDANRQVGAHLHLHPQVMVQAVFDDAIEGWNGVPQTYVVDHFLSAEPEGGGFLLMPTFAPPVTASSLTPGFGAGHREWMSSYSRVAMATVMLHDRTEGRVELDDQGRATITYHLLEADRSDLADGMHRAVEIYFAAGAKSVLLPYTDRVEMKSLRDPGPLQRGVRANDPLLVSYQPHGTLRMGKSARDSVVGSRGAAHEVAGLYVADASLFPTAVGVPPQLAVMAFAARVADEVRSRLGGSAQKRES
jgi:choline dehydrogenase-like flavoprotein